MNDSTISLKAITSLLAGADGRLFRGRHLTRALTAEHRLGFKL
jgi:hypothetical protein